MTIGIQQLLWQNERIRDTFHEAVHGRGDVDAALAVTAPDCALLNVPAGTGATGDGLRRYLAEDVVPHRPSGLAFRRVSRTVDKFRVVEESVVSFVHDRELPWLLPGVAPTGRAVEVLAVSVVTVRLSRITSHRTLWDHAGLLARLTG
ncbi:MAG: nuclear transport factor 2 family protein [Pseudonocardiales bacterium]|jgi:carboxymethylenebutenolidase|nr:nuclear transport factor 2 family protein [Pseudonocardiales bacterium]